MFLQTDVTEAMTTRPDQHRIAHGQTTDRAVAAPPELLGEGQAVAGHSRGFGLWFGKIYGHQLPLLN